MAKFTLTKLILNVKNLDSMPEGRTDYKSNISFTAGLGSLSVQIDAEIMTDNCDVSLNDISKKVQDLLSNLEV